MGTPGSEGWLTLPKASQGADLSLDLPLLSSHFCFMPCCFSWASCDNQSPVDLFLLEMHFACSVQDHIYKRMPTKLPQACEVKYPEPRREKPPEGDAVKAKATSSFPPCNMRVSGKDADVPLGKSGWYLMEAHGYEPGTLPTFHELTLWTLMVSLGGGTIRVCLAQMKKVRHKQPASGCPANTEWIWDRNRASRAGFWKFSI